MSESESNLNLNLNVTDLLKELDALGGGDVRLCKVSTICRVYQSKSGGKSVIEVVNENKMKMMETGKSYLFDSVYCSDDSVAKNKGVADVILDCFWDGFNVNLLTYGAQSSGKTFALFNDNDGICINFLDLLFKRIDESESEKRNYYSVSFHAFEIINNDITQLLSQPVNIPNYSEAISLLNQTRNNNNSHSFFKYSLFNRKTKTTNDFHIIDLIGSTCFFDSDVGHMVNRSNSSKERRITNQQLLSFRRMIVDISYSNNVNVPAGVRDWKLTKLIYSLLKGNSKTFFLACVFSDSSHYLETVNTLQLLSKVSAISTMCVRGRQNRNTPSPSSPVTKSKTTATKTTTTTITTTTIEYETQIAELQQRNFELEMKVKLLQTQSFLPEMFQMYQNDIDRLIEENTQLHKEIERLSGLLVEYEDICASKSIDTHVSLIRDATLDKAGTGTLRDALEKVQLQLITARKENKQLRSSSKKKNIIY